MIIIVQRHVCLDHAWHEWGTRLSSHNWFPRSIMKGFIFFTHLCERSVKTELIYWSNCAKNSCNRVLVGTIVDRRFCTVFALELTSAQWTRASEDWVFAFCKCQHHLLCNSVPFSLWTVFTNRVPFFSEPGPRNDHCPAPNLLANTETSWAFDTHSILLSFDPHEMSWNIDMKMVLPVKLSGVSLNLSSNSWTSWLRCNVLNPWKIFHSNSIGSPSILSKVLYSSELLKRSNLCSHAVFDWGFSCILPRHNTRIWKYVDSCALKTDDLFITNQRQILPWRVFPTNCFQSRDLILLRHQSCRYVEHLFHCEIFCILDGMPTVWVILSHEYRWFQCWRHEHSPYHRMFFAVFCNINWRSFLPFSHLIIHPIQEWSGS